MLPTTEQVGCRRNCKFAACPINRFLCVAPLTEWCARASSRACLTGIMILVFLGSWRSTLIIAVSIPLSILVSLIVLGALGETINIMTLGGLALAVGILVDDATVEIENINRNLEEGKERGAGDPRWRGSRLPFPAFVSTLSICIVFVPMFFLSGVAQVSLRALGRSRDLRHAGVLPAFPHRGADHGQVSAVRARSDVEQQRQRSRNPLIRVQLAVRAQVRAASRLSTSACCSWPSRTARYFCSSSSSFVFSIGSFAALPLAGAGLLSLGRCRPVQAARAGSDRHAHRRHGPAVRSSRQCHSPGDSETEIVSIIDNIGIPYSGINLSYTSTRLVVAGRMRTSRWRYAEKHHPTDVYVQDLRGQAGGGVSRESRSTSLPVDMVTQILNFGLPAPIDIQVIGHERGGQSRFRRSAAEGDKLRARHRGSTHPAAFRSAQAAIDVNRSKARTSRIHPAGRRQQPAGLDQWQLSDQRLPSGSIQETVLVTTSPCNRRSMSCSRLLIWKRSRDSHQRGDIAPNPFQQ